MAVNITFPELRETKGTALPSASQESLRQLREEMCSQSSSRDFKLQTYQRFLRRVLSPDSPTRGLLMVHGTGTGKTCTAIQIAEEYIIRPEFQDKKVLVLASPPVQENFKTQVFNMSRVTVDPDGLLLSKQCTGRRYLDMLLRIQSEPLKWTDKATKEKMNDIAQNIIKEFYEFKGYGVFANELETQKLAGGVEGWIHKTFDNRLIIIDEAHNIRTSEEGVPLKIRSMALEQIIKTANNVTLILLTATPMYDDYSEIIFYFNLFLWNERKLKTDTSIQPSAVFTKTGQFQEGMESKFRGWCQDYVSFVKGDNPLTFPFRLPPPTSLISEPATVDMDDKPIPPSKRRNVLKLTQSFVKGIQQKVLTNLKNIKGLSIAEPTLCVFPENATFRTTFVRSQDADSEYDYAQGVSKFLAPSVIAEYSSKFALVNKIIKESTGLIFVYSNLVEFGAQLFAMCLEEHGYESAIGKRLLKSTAGEIDRGSAGKYLLFTSDISATERTRAFERLKSKDNKDGNDIKIIVASPSISEGVDLQYIRQVHVLDYWWNMSRIEQVVGRGIRTCSHQSLDFENQNCTVYLHICKLENSNKELIDEFYYRTMVERKAKAIAAVKSIIMESAMDCPIQQDINGMPESWRNLTIDQTMAQGNKKITLTLSEMASPMFGSLDITCKIKELPEDPNHERPLSAYLDVRDEILDKFLKLFLRKPVWSIEDLFGTPQLRSYDSDVVLYTLQNAIESGFQLKDRNGRIGHLESRGKMYAFTTGKFNALQDRYIKEDKGTSVQLKEQEVARKVESSANDIIKNVKWPEYIKTRFGRDVLEWYTIDHTLAPEERIKYMLSLDWDNLPAYMRHLKAGDLKILGSKQIYNRLNERITPIGDQADAYNKWVSERISAFVESRKQFFATMKEDKILFNLDEDSDTLAVAVRSKNIGGRACTNFPDKLLNTFAEWLGESSPNEIKTKPERCRFISLLFRTSILKGRKDIVWWTPEEWSIFNEEQNRKEILLKLKE